MNVFSLWVGPYHIDFKIPLKGAQNSRISFNFKISQGVHLKIINTETEMLPLQPHFNDERFTFSLQSVVPHCLSRSASNSRKSPAPTWSASGRRRQSKAGSKRKIPQSRPTL